MTSSDDLDSDINVLHPDRKPDVSRCESYKEQQRPDKFQFTQKYKTVSNEDLHRKWLEIDPITAQTHHPNDRRKALSYVTLFSYFCVS